MKQMERWNLTLLNGVEGYIGENTREQGGESSAIDFMLTNQSIFRTFEKMHIDEQRKEFDLSDHFLIKTTFLENGNKINNRKIKATEVSYYKLNDNNLRDAFIADLERDLMVSSELDMEIVEKKIILHAEANLKCSFIRREKKDALSHHIEPVWMTSELRRQIALQREYNRKRRNAAREQMEQWRVRYQWQKEMVRQMILEEKGKHEEKIRSEIKQAKDSGKKMWLMIKKN